MLPNPQVEYLPEANRWRLLMPLVTPEITIPAGFETDGATVPRFLWSLFPPTYRFFTAAIVHDYMYEQAIDSKAEADALFTTNLHRLGLSRCYILPMSWAVRRFGRGNYPR